MIFLWISTNVLLILDYTKASYTNTHQLLFSIIQYVGLSAKATDFIKNYLSNHFLFVETSVDLI